MWLSGRCFKTPPHGLPRGGVGQVLSSSPTHLSGTDWLTRDLPEREREEEGEDGKEKGRREGKGERKEERKGEEEEEEAFT
jgi:hypothetical protein